MSPPAPSPPPPARRTRPSGSRRAVEWYRREVLIAAIVDQDSVAGSQISALYTAPLGSLNALELLPPVTRTLPSGRIVAFRYRRPTVIELVYRHCGVASFRLMTSAEAVAGLPPPTIRTLPGSYMTDGPP